MVKSIILIVVTKSYGEQTVSDGSKNHCSHFREQFAGMTQYFCFSGSTQSTILHVHKEVILQHGL